MHLRLSTHLWTIISSISLVCVIESGHRGRNRLGVHQDRSTKNRATNFYLEASEALLPVAMSKLLQGTDCFMLGYR